MSPYYPVSIPSSNTKERGFFLKTTSNLSKQLCLQCLNKSLNVNIRAHLPTAFTCLSDEMQIYIGVFRPVRVDLWFLCCNVLMRLICLLPFLPLQPLKTSVQQARCILLSTYLFVSFNRFLCIRRSKQYDGELFCMVCVHFLHRVRLLLPFETCSVTLLPVHACL